MAAPYTVQSKDTLYSLAKKFNVPLEVLTRVNKLTEPSLKIGQILEIPERQHTVVKGDTLFSLAKRFGTTIQALSDLNKLGSSGISLGQVILIPWEASFFAPSTAASATKPPTVSSATKPPVSSPVIPKPASSTLQTASLPITAQPPNSSQAPQVKPLNSPVPPSSTAKPSVTSSPSGSWRSEPTTVLPQMPTPDRPASSFPNDPSSAKTKVWNLITTAPLPVFSQDPVTPPATTSDDPTFTYTVVVGDTLYSIAKRYSVTVDLLRSSNSLQTDALKIGQVLQIPQADSSQGKSLRGIAERYLGVDYVYGGSSANGLDCSGFTSIVFKEFGIALPRTSAQQFLAGQQVEPADLREGDLVFFDTLGRGVSHVGIYLSDGEFIHAASNPGRVIKSKLSEKYYASRYLGARRIISDE